MKKILIICLCALLICGCGAKTEKPGEETAPTTVPETAEINAGGETGENTDAPEFEEQIILRLENVTGSGENLIVGGTKMTFTPAPESGNESDYTLTEDEKVSYPLKSDATIEFPIPDDPTMTVALTAAELPQEYTDAASKDMLFAATLNAGRVVAMAFFYLP